MSKPNQSKRARRVSKELAWAKKSGRWSMARMVRPGCPTPQKRRFTDREAAEANAPEGRIPYRCPCGEWHLTTKKPKP